MPPDDDEKRTSRFIRIRDVTGRGSNPDAETLAECPLCSGLGLVTFRKLAEILARYPELDPPEPPSEPPKDAA